jgi:hypothetical protein
MTPGDVFSMFGEIYWSLIHLYIIGTNAYKFADGDNIAPPCFQNSAQFVQI